MHKKNKTSTINPTQPACHLLLLQPLTVPSALNQWLLLSGSYTVGMVILFAVLANQSLMCSIILLSENIPSNYESAFLQAMSQTKQIKTHPTILQIITAKSYLVFVNFRSAPADVVFRLEGQQWAWRSMWLKSGATFENLCCMQNLMH